MGTGWIASAARAGAAEARPLTHSTASAATTDNNRSSRGSPELRDEREWSPMDSRQSEARSVSGRAGNRQPQLRIPDPLAVFFAYIMRHRHHRAHAGYGVA